MSLFIAVGINLSRISIVHNRKKALSRTADQLNAILNRIGTQLAHQTS